ncbi:hypothetical protein R1sor_027216 [Riccia sorocarpa]|uniref:Uncharacterized protein n=1 Tax=Riccia sorocarpa TaxID=122646 RepID=A0ABD3GDM0_9MARC
MESSGVEFIRWEEKKMELIEQQAWQGDGRSGTSEMLINPGKSYFLELVADVVREVNQQVDKSNPPMKFALRVVLRNAFRTIPVKVIDSSSKFLDGLQQEPLNDVVGRNETGNEFPDSFASSIVRQAGGQKAQHSRAGSGSKTSFSLIVYPRSLVFTLQKLGQHDRPRRRVVARCIPTWKLKNRYEEALKERLNGSSEAEVVIRTIMQTSAEIFTEACRNARRMAITAMKKERAVAVRCYKNLVRSSKRKYLRELQLILVKEFRREPQKFWQRLKTQRVKPELQRSSLISYLEQLYHIPMAEGMPQAEGQVCTFSKTEVEDAIKGMRSGAAPDFNGLTEEFVGIDEDEGNRSPHEQANLAFTMGQQLTDQLQAWALYKGMQILSMEGYPTLLGHTLAEFKDLERENEDLRQELNQLKAETKSTNELQHQLDEVNELARKYKRKAKHQYKQRLLAEDTLDEEKYKGLEDLVLTNLEELREMVEPSSSVQDKEEEDLEEEAVIEEGLVVDLLKAAQDGVTAAQDLSLKAWEGITHEDEELNAKVTKIFMQRKEDKTVFLQNVPLEQEKSSSKKKKEIGITRKLFGNQNRMTPISQEVVQALQDHEVTLKEKPLLQEELIRIL